tara:strand:+ start:465 stop:614 length:150 start_codon:yes stop_codon:yes gene_type:complete
MGKRKCWREWQLCGMCGVQEHPDEYCTRTRGIVAGKGYFYGSKQKGLNI